MGLAYRPPVFEPLQLSASAIDSYNTCPQKYLFGKVWGIPGGPAAATTFGNVMHTTIRQFVGMLRKGQRPPFEEVETIFRREWTSAGFEDKYQEEMYQRDGIEQLRAFHASALAAPPDVFAQEKGFTLDLEHGVQITGRLDQINRLGPGQVGNRRLQNGKAEDRNPGAKGSATGHLRAGGARGAGTGADPAGLLQPAEQSVRRGNTRGETASGSAGRRSRKWPPTFAPANFPRPRAFSAGLASFDFLCPGDRAATPRVAPKEPEAVPVAPMAAAPICPSIRPASPCKIKAGRR